MTSEEYINQINRLIDLQNVYLGIFLAIFSIVIAYMLVQQWRLSDKQIEQMKNEITREYEEKIFSEMENVVKIKSGTNVNGIWSRYSDGTLVCRHTIVLHSQNFQKDIVWTLPVRYFDKNFIVLTELDDQNIVGVTKIIKNESQVILLLDKLENKNNIGEYKLNLVAIGRWKREEENIFN